jgi:hypothetical protein
VTIHSILYDVYTAAMRRSRYAREHYIIAINMILQ